MINGSENARGANPFLASHGSGPVSFSANPGRSEGNPAIGLANAVSRVTVDEHNQSPSNMPVKYRIASNQTTNAFTITLLVPKNKDPPSDHGSPFRKVQDSTPNKPEKETYVFHVTMSQLLSQSQSLSGVNTPTWLDSPTLRKRLSEGGNAVGLDSHQIYQSIAAVEESVARIPGWIPDGTESVNVDIYLAEGLMSIVAIVSPKTHTVGGLDFSFTSFQSKGETIAVNQSSIDERMSIFSTVQGDRFQRSDMANGLFGQHSSSLDSWMATASDSRMNFVQDLNNNSSTLFQSSNPYQGSSSDRPVRPDHLFGGPDLRSFNTFQNVVQVNERPSSKRPVPSSIIEPLLSMGFTRAECDAAVSAIQNLSKINNTKNPPGYNDLLSHEYSGQGVDNVGGLNSQIFGSNERNTSISSEPRHEEDTNTTDEDNKKTGPVWGNAGKLKVVKSCGTDEDPNTNITTDESTAISVTSASDAQPQKLVKVLDIPPEMNAFVFHCNANTREESLQRCLFG